MDELIELAYRYNAVYDAARKALEVLDALDAIIDASERIE